MRDDSTTDAMFDEIVQVIGVAHTYRPSLAVRHHLTKDIPAFHSSQNHAFSYFYKGDKRTLARNEEFLHLRKDPVTGSLADHWPEPELAVFLGNDHDIIGYTLANDFTAISIEKRGRTKETDNTFLGKSWNRSGSIGPRFVSSEQFGNPSEANIKLTIYRDSHLIYQQGYYVARCLYSLTDIPHLVSEMYTKKFHDSKLPSKRIVVDSKNELPYGTVIMLGTGLIVPPKYYCMSGDKIIVSCNKIGELINFVTT